ncbi:MAG: hypothetical protein ACI9LO_003021 [Planctomycetota bacterium]|jgi:hypothetical protein
MVQRFYESKEMKYFAEAGISASKTRYTSTTICIVAMQIDARRS